MYRLPYMIEVFRHDADHFDDIIRWCYTQWPLTHQATWSVGYYQRVMAPQTLEWGYLRIWRFQRKEDLQLFSLTWTSQ